MSLHYLVDPFATAQNVIDVTAAENGESNSTGALLVRVPDGVGINGYPGDLTALLTAKYAGLLAFYGGFTSIVHDACLTSTGISAAGSTKYQLGGGLVNHCIYDGGRLVTSPVGLSSSPEQCLVVWEVYSFRDDDPKAGRFSRTYVEELDPTLMTCSVAFAGLASQPAMNGHVINIPAAATGNSVVLTFTNPSGAGGSRLYLGSWALLY